MTIYKMTGPDCAVMCNLINTHTHTHTHRYRSEIRHQHRTTCYIACDSMAPYQTKSCGGFLLYVVLVKHGNSHSKASIFQVSRRMTKLVQCCPLYRIFFGRRFTCNAILAIFRLKCGDDKSQQYFAPPPPPALSQTRCSPYGYQVLRRKH